MELRTTIKLSTPIHQNPILSKNFNLPRFPPYVERNIYFPDMKSYNTRLSTFKNSVRIARGATVKWPAQIRQTPAELARNGFFYNGYGDAVTCFYCGSTICNWETTTNIAQIHFFKNRKCNIANEMLRSQLQQEEMSTTNDSIEPQQSVNPESIHFKIMLMKGAQRQETRKLRRFQPYFCC